MSEEMALERRYRRLLSWYPPSHRATYGEEMIGVLLSSAEPGQQRPDPREALDLVIAGLRLRLRPAALGERSPASRSAAGAFGFLAALLIATLSWYTVVATLVWSGTFGRPAPTGVLAQLPRSATFTAVGWTLVVLAAGYGLRRVAALGAVLGVAAQATIGAARYDFAPDTFVASWWRLMLAASAAACLVALAAPGRDGDRSPQADPGGASGPGSSWGLPFGWRRTAAVGFAAALVVAAPAVDRASTIVTSEPGGAVMTQSRLPSIGLPGILSYMSGVVGLAGVVLLAVLVYVVLRLRPAVRRRVLLLATPTATAGLLVATTFQGFLYSSPRFSPSVHLTAGQWIALVATPALVFAAGAWLVRRYERGPAPDARVI